MIFFRRRAWGIKKKDSLSEPNCLSIDSDELANVELGGHFPLYLEHSPSFASVGPAKTAQSSAAAVHREYRHRLDEQEGKVSGRKGTAAKGARCYFSYTRYALLEARTGFSRGIQVFALSAARLVYTDGRPCICIDT